MFLTNSSYRVIYCIVSHSENTNKLINLTKNFEGLNECDPQQFQIYMENASPTPLCIWRGTEEKSYELF